MRSHFNTIKITDDDYNQPPISKKITGGKKYPSDFVETNQNYANKNNSYIPQRLPSNKQVNYVEDDHSDNDYTQYTANSALEDSFELDSQAQALLDYNSYLIQGFQNYINKDSDGLIQSYRSALSCLETQTNPNIENLITAKCNLGIAHFFNSEIKEAVAYIGEALSHFNSDSEKN